jgi:hypothetical protein
LDGAGNTGSDGKAPAKTKNCCFRLLNVLFSDEISPKFSTIGAKKDKNLLDTGLAANDEYFWQEVAEKYQDVNDDYECLAWDAPKFSTIGAKKDKNLLDTGLAANDEYFWQEVAEKYQDVNDDYECLAWDDPLFDDIDASVALPHTWSKLRKIYKGLSKLYSEAFENHKKRRESR